MHCDDARKQLFDRPQRSDAGAAGAAALAAHLEACPDCQALERDIDAMHARARVWHELDPPPWNRDPVPWRAAAAHPQPAWPGRLAAWLPRWLPMLASSAALLLSLGLYWRDPSDPPGPPPAGSIASPEAERLLAASRRERREEMQALSALLKAEMDRRALQTEQSLKYIISHQIRSQRQLEAMRGTLQPARTSGAVEQL